MPFNVYRYPLLVINRRHQFALAQIGNDAIALRALNTKCNAAAGAAAIKTQHQTRAIRGAAMHMRIDAKATVVSSNKREPPLAIGEARTPHERAITEHPEIAFAVHGAPSALFCCLYSGKASVESMVDARRCHSL